MNETHLAPELPDSFEEIGKMAARSAHDIADSPWSIGGETMDRDYTDFSQWRQYLAPLGAKKIRLQAGWAKCEREPGVYDFEWLDKIIDGVIASGVEPWLQTSYNNPVYGGERGLFSGMPQSEEALLAWDRWVRTMARRYSGRVKIWEVWNEPDNHKGENIADTYADLYIRTAEIIREEVPDATLYAGSLAFPGKPSFTDRFLSILRERDKLHLVDTITFHGYYFLPAQAYQAPYRLNDKEIVFSPLILHDVVRRYSSRIRIMQGEQGAPSVQGSSGALGGWEWTELRQAKWLLRRLLTDWGHGVESTYFGIIDMNYAGEFGSKINRKGLLHSNDDRSVSHVKPSYYAFQYLAALFDFTLQPLMPYPHEVESNRELSVYGFSHVLSGFQAIAIWQCDEWPTDSLDTRAVDFVFPAAKMNTPVLVDLRTGSVHRIPSDNIRRTGTRLELRGIPVYDSPVLIVELSLLPLQGVDHARGEDSGVPDWVAQPPAGGGEDVPR
ncbi:MAG: GH39 family glycosyl hydrolase [Verrucomicrobiota bacterium]